MRALSGIASVAAAAAVAGVGAAVVVLLPVMEVVYVLVLGCPRVAIQHSGNCRQAMTDHVSPSSADSIPSLKDRSVENSKVEA